MKKILLFCCAVMTVAVLQAQNTIHVPGDFPTIQEGINAAAAGDIVLVSDGIYFEQITFPPFPLTVASEYLTTGDASHIENTVIDGDSITEMDSASVVYFISGQDTTSVLCGFTIRHGKGTFGVIGSETFRAGGGIYIYASGAKIIHNHITDNHLNDTLQGDPDYLDGAGINIGIDSPNWVVIDNNVIDHNSTYAIHGLAARTAGIGAFDHNCLITNNTISWNTCTSEGTTNAIAGACAAYSPMLYEYTVKMQNNLFSHNLVQNNSTIVSTWAVWACGGFQNVTGIFTGNVVEYNESFAASENHFAGGGVMEFINPGPGSIVQGNTFRENITNSEGGALKFDLFQPEADRLPIPVENNYFYFNNAYNGGALHTWNVPVALVNNVFNGNYADVHGGAVFLRKTYFFNIHHIATLVNNSFYGNKAGTNGGGVYTVSYVKPLIINSIFWNDSSSVQQGNEIFLSSTGDTVEIANTDVDFGKLHGNVVDGGSNINVDPQFEDLLTLLINNDSPCFNTGTSSFTCLCGQVNPAPAYDITGMPRPQYGNFDLGAWEGLYVGIGGDPINNSGLRINNKPNPFTGSTTLTYGLSEPGTVTLRIDNGYGQTVSVLVNGYQQKGEHQVTWNAENLPSGIYYYRIEAGGKTAGGVMVKR